MTSCRRRRKKIYSKSSEEEEDVSFEADTSSVFRPTISDNNVPTDPPATTATPFFPTFGPTSPSTTTSSAPVIRLTEQPRRQSPRRLEIFNLEREREEDSDLGEVRLGNRASSPSEPSTRPTRPGRQRQRQRGRTSVGLGRTTTTTRTTRTPLRTTIRTTTQSLFQTSFSQPAQPRQPVQPARVVPTSDLAAALLTPPGSRQPIRVTPSQGDQGDQGERAEDKEYFYEYYYDYLEDDSQGHATDYDLVPLANKVRILSSGLPHCLDVGVFPHPFSCKKFVNCYRNPGQGITGSIYQCPSYLAFDPVGGRCNWVNEIVCTSGK